MQYIHVIKLEKYHPGYKDRDLKWAKMYFGLVQGDPDFELIENEIDKWRFMAMICLELQAKKPLPNDNRYWAKKGFDLKKRSMSLTLQVLHTFLEFVTHDTDLPSRNCNTEKDKEKEKEEEKEKERCNKNLPTSHLFKNLKIKTLWDGWLEVRKKMRVPNTERALLINIKKLEGWGEVKAEIALTKSIERGWRGVFEPKPNELPRRVERNKPLERPAVNEEDLAKVNKLVSDTLAKMGVTR